MDYLEILLPSQILQFFLFQGHVPTYQRTHETRTRRQARACGSPGAPLDGRQHPRPRRPGRQHQTRQTKITEKIDGTVVLIMALDRAIRCGNQTSNSSTTAGVYSYCYILKFKEVRL